MSNTKRIDKKLFVEEHYLGKPADFNDRIITRRVNLAKKIENFVGKDLELVDIGCGNGASMFMFADEMKNCTGIEIHGGHLNVFNNFKEANNITNCEFKQLNIETEKYDKKFDRLISFEVIEHLKYEKSVKFYYDVLRKGGIAAISVPNKWWIFETHGASLPLLPWNRVPFFSWLPKPIHEKYSNARIYTKSRIKKLLESVGFRVEDVFYVTAPMDVLKEGKLKKFLINNIFNTEVTQIAFLATSLFIIAKKD